MTVHPTNPNYEYIQYNEDLTLIRSIKDNMFQIQSVMDCLPSNASRKNVNRYFEDPDTIELFDKFKENLRVPKIRETNQTPENAVLKENLSLLKNEEADQTAENDTFKGKLKKEKCEQIPGIYEIRNDVANDLKGTYIHRTLINDFAGWYSKKYKLKLLKFLDDYFQKQMERLAQRNKELTDQIVEKSNIIDEQTIKLQGKNDEIAKKDDVIDELDDEIAEQEQVIAAKEQVIAAKENVIDRKSVRTDIIPPKRLKIFQKKENEYHLSAKQSCVNDDELWERYTFPSALSIKQDVKRHFNKRGRSVIFQEHELPAVEAYITALEQKDD